MRLINLVFKSLILVNFLELAIASADTKRCIRGLAQLEVATFLAAEPLAPISRLQLTRHSEPRNAINVYAKDAWGPGWQMRSFYTWKHTDFGSHQSEDLSDRDGRMLTIEYFDRAQALDDPGVILTLDGAAFLTEQDATRRLQNAINWGRIPHLVDSAVSYHQQIYASLAFFQLLPKPIEPHDLLGSFTRAREVQLNGDRFWISKSRKGRTLYVSKQDPRRWNRSDPNFFRTNTKLFPIAPSKRERWKFGQTTKPSP